MLDFLVLCMNTLFTLIASSVELCCLSLIPSERDTFHAFMALVIPPFLSSQIVAMNHHLEGSRNVAWA